MGPNSSSSSLEGVLAEQQAFYRSVAAEYEKHLRTGVGGGGEPVAALDDLRPTGDVLELACGPGTWTAQLLRHADTVTAVDGSPEMLEIASARVTHPRVRFVGRCSSTTRTEPPRSWCAARCRS